MSKLQELIEKLCPNGVEYKKLKECTDMKRGTTATKKTLKKGEIPVISGGKEPAFYCNVYNRTGECITVAGSGAGAGYIQYWDVPVFVNDAFSIKGREMINTKFLYYCLSNMQGEINATRKGGGVPHVHISSIENFRVPVPPLEVQCEIVRILDNFTELIEELTAELIARKKQYEYYTDKIFLESDNKEYFMKDISQFIYGYTDKASNIGDTRFVRITDINEQGLLKKEEPKYIFINEEAKKSYLSKGDLVMARTGATYGKTLYYDEDYPSVYASFLIKIIPDNTIILNKFYWHFTKTSLYWEQANKLVTTGGQPQFNSPALKKIKIPIPSIDEQKKIIEVLDKFDKLVNDISEGLPAEIEKRKKQYEYYRDKLLTFKKLEK